MAQLVEISFPDSLLSPLSVQIRFEIHTTDRRCLNDTKLRSELFEAFWVFETFEYSMYSDLLGGTLSGLKFSERSHT